MFYYERKNVFWNMYGDLPEYVWASKQHRVFPHWYVMAGSIFYDLL